MAVACDTEIVIDGTIWEKLQVCGSSSKPPIYIIFKDISGPIGYAKRNIMTGNVNSAFHLIISRNMLEYIKCTEVEVCHVLRSDWKISIAKCLLLLQFYMLREHMKQNH